MPKILLCGDSFGTTDHCYPELHFSEKIAKKINDCEIINLSQGGASNFLIELQLHQGLRFKPDAVILMFTAPWRSTFVTKISEYLTKISNGKIMYHQRHYLKPNDVCKVKLNNLKKYITHVEFQYDAQMKGVSENDVIHRARKWKDESLFLQQDYINGFRDYFTAISLLNLLKLNDIPFCFSLGGFGSNGNKSFYNHSIKEHIVKFNCLTDELENHMSQSISVNLWDATNGGYDPLAKQPSFHVEDDNLQTLFANECIEKLKL